MKLSINIIANFLSRIWIAGIGIILVPQYIKFLGIESYGLVGFYGTLIGSMSILDLGLSTTLNRELTKARVSNTDPKEVRDLVYTLEIIYFSIGLFIAGAVMLLAPIIAIQWIKAEHLSVNEIINAVRLMGIIIAFQWPISLYNGGLMGMDKQPIDNIIMVAMTTIRSAGVIFIFYFIPPTIEIFFIWQAIISFIYMLTMRLGLWKYLPKAIVRPKFSMLQLKRVWHFAAGMTSIGLITFFLAQTDKILLSNMLPLTEYAYYMLAFTVAGGMSMFITPINLAVFPKLTALVVKKDQVGLIKAYHQACRIVAVIIFPVGLMLIFFTNDILFIWTGNIVTVTHMVIIVKIMVAGSIVNSLMVGPYLLLLANGETRFTIIQNLILVIIFVPLLFWLVDLYGALGGALVWLMIHSACLIVSVPLIHKKYLSGELKTWYLKDTLLPFLSTLLAISIIKLLLNNYLSLRYLNLLEIIIIFIIVAFCSILFLPENKLLFKFLKLS